MGRRATGPAGEWWVDDSGEWRDESRLGQFSASTADDARLDRDTTAFFFLGMVNIVADSHRIRIRWSVPDVDSESLRAAFAYLESVENPPRIYLEFFFGAWERRIFTDKFGALDCLETAMRYRHAVPLPKPFVREMSVDDRHAVLPAIRSTLAAWDRCGGRFSFRTANALSPFRSRLLFSAPDEYDGCLNYRFLGNQAALTRFKGMEWAGKVVGTAYGQGVDNASQSDVLVSPYHEVLTAQQPRFDHVRASIRRGDKVPEWVNYQRLLLPAKTDDGGPGVLCMVVKTLALNIPLPAQTA